MVMPSAADDVWKLLKAGTKKTRTMFSEIFIAS